MCSPLGCGGLSPKETDDASDLHLKVLPAGDVTFPEGVEAEVHVMCK